MRFKLIITALFLINICFCQSDSDFIRFGYGNPNTLTLTLDSTDGVGRYQYYNLKDREFYNWNSDSIAWTRDYDNENKLMPDLSTLKVLYGRGNLNNMLAAGADTSYINPSTSIVQVDATSRDAHLYLPALLSRDITKQVLVIRIDNSGNNVKVHADGTLVGTIDGSGTPVAVVGNGKKLFYWTGLKWITLF